MTSFAVPAPVGSRLASIAARLPAKTAVVEGDARIEFAQLNASATTIAEAIVAAGGGSEGLVCLLFESKIAALKAIFGSARSGKAYIALDPSDPDERLQFILQDGQPVVLLTEAPLVARAQALAGGRCAIIDIDDTDPGAVKRALPEISADAPLYLITLRFHRTAQGRHPDAAEPAFLRRRIRPKASVSRKRTGYRCCSR